MPNIKKMIFKESQKISAKTDLDITPEELANLALYKFLNLPYFNDVHNFVKMHYNVFDEITLGLPPLNNVKGYSNDTIKSFVIQMNKEDLQPEKIEYKDQILNKQEYKLFKSFMDDLNSSKDIDELIKKIEIHETTTPFYLNIIMNITNTESYKGNKLIRALERYSEYKYEDSVEEFKFENLSKTTQYRSIRSLGDINDFAYDHYSLKGFSKKSFEEIMEAVNQRDIDAITGIANFFKEGLARFHETHPEQYEKSIFKIFKEISDPKLRDKAAFNLNYFESERKVLNNDYKKLLQNGTCEEILEKYNNQINDIINKISKKYPQILGNVEDQDYTINRFVYMKNEEKVSFIKKESPLEIFHANYTELEYRSIRGIRFFKNEYRADEGFYIGANNGLEDIAAADGYFMDNISFNGNRGDLKNIRLSRITEVGRDINIQVKQDLIENAIKLAQELKCIFVYDIMERDHKAQNDFNNQMAQCITNLKKKYPDVIFFNDCIMLDEKSYLESTIKSELLTRLYKENIPYEKIISANNELEKYFKTEDFIESSKLNYSGRMGSIKNREQLEVIISNVSKNKIKNKLSM